MIRKSKQYQIVLESSQGPVTLFVTKKPIKRIIIRYDEMKEVFNVSTPLSVSEKELRAVFYEHQTRFFKVKQARKNIQEDPPYYFGKMYESYTSILQSSKSLTREQYFHKIKPSFRLYLEKRVREYEGKMAIPIQHQVKVRTMKTRWGTNATHTKTLTFNTTLSQYHPDIIDAIVVHELAHYFIHGHQQNFYQLVHDYCPNYSLLDFRLKRRNYANI